MGASNSTEKIKIKIDSQFVDIIGRMAIDDPCKQTISNLYKTFIDKYNGLDLNTVKEIRITLTEMLNRTFKSDKDYIYLKFKSLMHSLTLLQNNLSKNKK